MCWRARCRRSRSSKSDVPAFLVDVNLSIALAVALRSRAYECAHLADWQDGRYRTASDETTLAVAAASRRVLVTLDAATIPALAQAWLARGQDHAGVIVISSRIQQQDIGRQLRGVVQAIESRGDISWRNQIVYVSRPA